MKVKTLHRQVMTSFLGKKGRIKVPEVYELVSSEACRIFGSFIDFGF